VRSEWNKFCLEGKSPVSVCVAPVGAQTCETSPPYSHTPDQTEIERKRGRACDTN